MWCRRERLASGFDAMQFAFARAEDGVIAEVGAFRVRIALATVGAAGGGGGGSVPVQDEGVPVVLVPTALNFTGTGVAVTDVGGVATVAVAGGAGTPFDIHDDITDELVTLAGTDRFAVSNEGDAGDPMEYVTAEVARSYMRPAEVPLAEAEAGTSTSLRSWTPERVGQAIAALAPSGGGGLTEVATDGTITGDGRTVSPLRVQNPFTAADETKLDGIEAGADANVGETFTSAEQTKLTGIEAGATADQTGAEIVTDINTELGSETWQGGGGGGGGAYTRTLVAEVTAGAEATYHALGLTAELTEGMRFLIVAYASGGTVPRAAVEIDATVLLALPVVTATPTTSVGALGFQWRQADIIGSFSVNVLDQVFLWRRNVNNLSFGVAWWRGGALDLQVWAVQPGGAQGDTGPEGPPGPGFDIHDDVTTPVTPNAGDRMIVSDESGAGDPMRYVTLLNLTNFVLPATVSTTEAEAGTSAANRVWSPERVAEAIAALAPTGGGGLSAVAHDTTLSGDGTVGDPLGVANAFTANDETKLDGIETGAEVNIGQEFTLTLRNKLNGIEAGAEVNDPFDLHDDASFHIGTLATSDRLVVSDESVGGDPNRYATVGDMTVHVRDSMFTGFMVVRVLTQAAYDALTPAAQTVYVITA